jgi:hypothetical protein
VTGIGGSRNSGDCLKEPSSRRFGVEPLGIIAPDRDLPSSLRKLPTAAASYPAYSPFVCLVAGQAASGLLLKIDLAV